MAEIRNVTLAGSGIQTTSIGFGCSNLLGDKTREQGLALLEAAFDAGVRHFDVARYYGFGDAEGIVGEFAARRRDRITITTKFGLQPMKAVAASRVLIDGVRRLMRASAFVRKIVRRQVRGLVQHSRFDVNSARASVEESLRQLRAEYIDVLLLHEAEVTDCKEELLEFLLDMRSKGTIRSFGVGSGFPRTQAICRAVPQFSEVAQFDSQLFNPNVSQIAEAEPSLRSGARTRITHGSMSAIDPLLKRLRADTDLARQVSEVLGRDAMDRSVLASVVLAESLAANPGGIVLFRSASFDRIRSNIDHCTSWINQNVISRLNAMESWQRAVKRM